jgi:hypothetical protein
MELKNKDLIQISQQGGLEKKLHFCSVILKHPPFCTFSQHESFSTAIHPNFARF